MIAFEQALATLLDSVRPVGSERVPLEQAVGRVLAEDVVATIAMPAFDHSSMDGYAVRTADFSGGPPFSLPVAGQSAAGRPAPALEPGTACRIFTGAELPAGADAVVPQEDVERREQTAVFAAAPATGACIRRRGDDLAEGGAALGRGQRLRAGAVALAAALDRTHVMCARRPVVTILCTGDELRSPGERPRPASIVESNGYFVAAAAAAAGAIARVGPFVRDDLESASAAVREALRGTDVLVTVGGVSVGEHDVVRPALEKAGTRLDYWRVAIKPGKPLAVGRSGDAHVLGLPGNPASASLTFLLFGVPLLRALQGDLAPVPSRAPARVDLCGRPFVERRAGRMELYRANLAWSGGCLVARVLPNQASGAVTSFARADGLVVVPAERERVDSGDVLEAIRIDDI